MLNVLENINKKRATAIYRRRKNVLKLTREAAAKICKISAQSFVRAEDSEFNVDIATLRAISEGLKIPLSELIPFEEKERASEVRQMRARLNLYSLISRLDDSQVARFLALIEAELGLDDTDDPPASFKKSQSS